MGILFFGDPLEIRTPDPLLKRHNKERNCFKKFGFIKICVRKADLLKVNNSY